MRYILLLIGLLCIPAARGAQPAADYTTERDVTYGTVDGKDLKLDLYQPTTRASEPAPVAIFIHGGGWRHGSKVSAGYFADVGKKLIKKGYVVASVDYRLAPEYKWPAFMEDVKGAVRWLRANATKYNLDTNRFGAWGGSAGGHLVSMLGTTDPSAKLEGPLNPGYSSRIQAVVDLYGPTDFLAPRVEDLVRDNELVSQVFGTTNVLKAASPVTYVSADDPPFLIIHGANDVLVPIQQGEILNAKLKEAGVPVKIVTVKNGTHGLGNKNIQPSKPEIEDMIVKFFDDNLRKDAPKK